ncbi:MAG: DUF1552 domain-containing protein [Pseudomonadota bacterium]
MSKKTKDRLTSRRQFLIGAGHTILTLPPLISLLPQNVLAQAVTQKVRVMTFVNPFGIDPSQMFPSNPAGLTPYTSALDTYYNRLSALPSQLSRVVNFNNADLSGLEDQTNVIRGLDLVGGKIGGHNHAVLSGTHAGGRSPSLGASIDTILERQLGLNAIRLRTTSKASNKADEFSFWRPSPGAARQVSSLIYGDEALFNLMFPNGTGGSQTTSPPETTGDELIVDKVLEDLNDLQKHRRLSADDKQRLDEYVTSVHELQKKIIAQRQPAAVTCQNSSLNYEVPIGSRATPNADSLYDNYTTLIALAVQCDRAQIAHIGNTAVSALQNNAAHPELHHGCSGGSGGNADRNAWFLQKIGALAKKLDSRVDPLDPNGNSLLYNSILLWTNELGTWSTAHSVTQIPTVTFGSGGGYFRTGYFVDYRARPFVRYKNIATVQHMYGRPYKQLLISIMRSAGLSRNQYINFGDGNGFGEWKTYYSEERSGNRNYYDRFNSEHNEPLPFLSQGG